MTCNRFEGVLRYRLKKPAANHEEARQTKKNKHSIVSHLGIPKAEMTDMRKHYENHRKSSHRIDVFYPLLCHNLCKGTNKCAKSQRLFGFSPTYDYLCGMKERINWIDWAKALAVCSVVFCHLPQSQEWFYYRYLQALTMVIFFFISGYLKKDRGSDKENWRKYLQSLITPYIIYNIIVYPYWILKFYLSNGTLPDCLQAMKPILGALLLEHENAFCEPLNGPLWYLPAILIMHIIIDLCRKTKHQHWIMITLCMISFVLYAANKYWYFAPNLTPMGLMRNLPYYYIGYLFGQYHLFRDCHLKHDIICSILCLSASVILFSWHLDAFYSDQHMLHIILFYPANIGFLFGVLYGCKVLDSYRLSIITNISIGTLVIVGLHIVAVTIVNFVLSHIPHFTFRFSPQYGYHWYEALSIALLIIAFLYPIILWSIKHAPTFIGRKLVSQTN